jgi:hypothetical protein
MCADGNTRAALPRLFLRVGIMAHEWICSRSGGRIHAAPCACGTPREELWRGCDRISCRWDAQKWFSDSTDFALPCPVLPQSGVSPRLVCSGLCSLEIARRTIPRTNDSTAEASTSTAAASSGTT